MPQTSKKVLFNTILGVIIELKKRYMIKATYLAASIFIVLFSFQSMLWCNSLRINIICDTHSNGLRKDYQILKDELLALGHQVHQASFVEHTIQEADVNIFVEVAKEALFQFARRNYFIPNPEWCIASPQLISKFDLILCRTREVERIFTPLNPKTYFLGFTSVDKFRKGFTKDHQKFLHVGGGSAQKGSKIIFDLWSHRPDLPSLTLVSGRNLDPFHPNVFIFKTHLAEDDLIKLQNECGIHLCPSETEGFGHYLVEAMSTGSVVITTDAPPMNEFIQDPCCLVGYNRTGKLRLGITYSVDPLLLEDKINDLLSLPQHELEKIGQHNRDVYIEQKQAFKERLKALVL